MAPHLADPEAALAVVDDDGAHVTLDADAADALLTMTGGLEGVTVSACADCRSRVLAVMAFVDLLELAPPHPQSGELMDLAIDAPTPHLCVVDLATTCAHPAWRDPLFEEWSETVDAARDELESR